MDWMHGVFKPTHKTPVVTSLKQCVKKIEDAVGELKQSFNKNFLEEIETSCYLEKSHSIKKEINYLQVARQCCRQVEHSCNKLFSKQNVAVLTRCSFVVDKHDCSKLKSLLNKDIERTKAYFYDMEDLTLDIEEEVGILEKHLKNYGYEPPELDTSCDQEYESILDDSCCENEISEKDISMTPQFPSYIHPILVVSSPKRDKEEAPIDVCDDVFLESLTPEFEVLAVEFQKKPRHILPSSPLPFLGIGSACKLGDVARRLDF